MTFTWEFFALLMYTAMIMVYPCKADMYPPPTGLSYEWLDNFTVNISWNKPSGLPDGSEIQFMLSCGSKVAAILSVCVPGTYRIERLLTEEMGLDNWTCNIRTVSNCPSSNESTPETIKIDTLKPPAQLVKDFNCLTYSKEMNCSWIPADPSLNLTLSYRTCGISKEEIKKCDQPYSDGVRNGCFLPINTTPDNICILVNAEAGMSTFKPVLEVPPPELSIAEEGNSLNVSWPNPEIGNGDCWLCEVCYKRCNKTEPCKKAYESPVTVPYDKSCLYEFTSIFTTKESCIKIFSKRSTPVTYGTNEHVRTPIVIAIVIPIILSVCVFLFCYCIWRHSSIICPVIPDPSAIFKEMMMNGNKELKATPESLYMPVPEPVEPCKITLDFNSGQILQEHSESSLTPGEKPCFTSG